MKPKTVQQQIAQGDPAKRGVHKLDQKLASTPKATRGLPDCPRHLRGRARAAWAFWKEELEGMGLDCRPDAMMLEGACVNYARAVDADLLVAAGGVTIEEPVMDSDGEQCGTKVKKNPAVEVSNAAWRNLRSFCSEFGLSPVSRERVTVNKPEDGEAEMTAQLTQPRPEKPCQKLSGSPGAVQ